jgi:multicomponent Na+:H+ antiporter subunit D
MILIFRKNPNLRETFSIGAGLLKFGIVCSMIPEIMGGKIIQLVIMDVFPGLQLKFTVDAFGLFFGFTSSLLWILTTLYSIGYMRSLDEHAQTRYFFSFALAMSSAIGVAFSGNLFTLFIFYELLTISTYPLVVHEESEEAMSAGRKYIAYLLTAGTFLLFSTVAVYYYTGTTDFSFGGILADKGIPESLLKLLFVTFMIGCTKAAFMPLHSWLPTAMIAPTPVSALLHAVAVVKAGVFTAVRIILYIYGVELMSETGLATPFAYFVSITIILASLFALSQDNLKLRLAYSTVSQLSYIVLGALLLTSSGITGGIFHIASHAFGKITLFFCAGSIYVASGLKNISELSGIGRKMPITMLSFAIATLTMIGLPPGAGFISKWYLALGTIEANQLVLLIVLLVSSILNAAYFLPVVYKAFFEEPNDKINGVSEATPFVYIPLLITAIGSILIFFYPDYFFQLARLALGV